jgi:hypothetical protein
MEMLNILKKLSSLDGSKTQSAPVEKPAVLTESKKLELDLPEPDMSELRALSGFKKQLNESALGECGMMGMSSPMPMQPQMPASINMSAGNAQEIVSMMRGIMDLAKSDTPSQGMGMPGIDPMMKALGDVDGDGDHDMKDHDLEKPDTGPLTAEPTNIDDSGSDELADIVKKIRTGDPVKISTDMPVKVSSDEPIKGSTTDKLNARSDGNDENEEYDNTPKPSTRDYDPNDFAHVINKVRDFDYVPPNSGSNPMPDPNDKKKEEAANPVAAFESKLMDDYRKFVAEGPNPEDVPAFIRKSKEPGKAAGKEANDKRNERVGAKVFSSPRK